MERTILCVLMLSATLPVVAWAEPDADVPEPVRPYLSFVEQCRQWQARDQHVGWKVVHDEDFNHDSDRWQQIDPQARLQQVGQDKAELVIRNPNGPAAMPIGPKVSGEFAIEMVGRVDQHVMLPMGIVLDQPTGSGPGFQIGHQTGTFHCVWTDSNDGTFTEHFYATDPRTASKTNYRIRLEVRKAGVTAYVDGRLYARAALSDAYDWNKLHQPHAASIYGGMVIQSFRIEVPTVDQGEPLLAVDDDAWQKSFNGLTHEQADAKAAELVQLLDADAWEVREAASRLLTDAGEFVLPALRDGIASDSAEVRRRAEEITRRHEPVEVDEQEMHQATVQTELLIEHQLDIRSIQQQQILVPINAPIGDVGEW